ncbi:YidC/Oxa1 family membrane protein insertase [Brachyspira hyodysenteriae]|uniref:YidC/Oxa1 family membrane protein insertase n=1 Tax=Brachyspira hyodysenteriae TaxID=159 RepID=UPI001ADD8FCB|nr:YidC/Oxa1 family membrane protein insertase [Brachyspira hyodysenteriae]MDA0079444.1 YidC/Oxa1 family membrane protein insertase [Brachyspira hyodysenteriae]QTM07451.1 sulfatase-like hydrolase/transferase [Brachyspira hyodysenteriae]
MFSDILYSLTIYPIEFILETIFYYFKVETQSSYTVSVILVSLIINILSLPLYNIAEKWQQKERDMQVKMKPMINNIKAVYKGDQAYLLIRTCQRINGYKTIYAFRGVLGLLIQIPFFLAGYNFFTSLTGAETESFFLIKSLGEADKIIHIGNYYINLLPFIMTAFSLASTFIYSKKLTFKESIPIFLMSLFFLVFLYSSPAILLLYWTINCAFSFFKNIVLINIEKIKNIISSISNNKIFILSAKIIYSLYTIFILIMTILYFLRNTLIVKSATEYPFLKLFIIHVKTYKDLLLIWFIISIVILLILINKKNILDFIKIESKLRLKIFISSLITITTLSGLFILTSLIASSGQEFENPFTIIFNVFFKYAGIFIVYPIFIYFLFSEKFKNNITFISIFIVLISLINTFVMVMDYGNISSNFKFELEYLLIPNLKQIIINIAFILLALFLTLIIIKKKLINLMFNILIIITISLFAVSLFDFVKINNEQKKLLEISSINNNLNNNDNIFNFSKTGTNIFIIILDRGNPEFGNIVFERFNDIKDEFDGFIWYPNTTAFGAATFGSIQALYGGYEYAPFELDGKYNLKDKHNEALLMMPQLFYDAGYDSVTFDPCFANFSWIPDLTIFKNYTNIKAYNQNNNMIEKELNNLLNDNLNNNINTNDIIKNNKNRAVRFSLFRMLPVFLRDKLYSKNDWFIPNAGRNLAVVGKSIQEYALLQALTNLTKINEEGNYFTIIHSDTTHEPFNYNTNFIPSLNIQDIPDEDMKYFGSDFSARSYYSTVASFRELSNFFKYLKENNIYDNTKIIIVSDHSGYFSPSEFDKNNMTGFKAFNSMLYFKDFNSKGNIVSNNTFMTIADVPYLAAKHLDNPKNPFTGQIITNYPKDSKGVDVIVTANPDPNANFEKNFNYIEHYNIKDNVFIMSNWTRIK